MKTTNGYKTVNVQGRLIYEHRLIWEQHNKASLLPWTNIHHKNGDRKDNRIENLIPIHIARHTELHLQEKRINDINKRKCGLCDKGTYVKKQKTRQSWGRGYYEYDSPQWSKNPLNKSQLICRKCYRRIMNKEFGKRV